MDRRVTRQDAPRCRPAQWRRWRRRRWGQRHVKVEPAAIFAAIPSIPRPCLARLTERMIDRMDEIDGDPDLEDTREDWEDDHDREYVDDI